MKTSAFIRKHNACREGAKWALSISEDMADVWDALIEQKKYEWLMWTATQPSVFPDSLRQLACRFVRETPLCDGRMVFDLLTDERSRNAIEAAERYADGKATTDELADAAHAARVAYDSAHSARVAAATHAAHAAADAAYAAAYTACAAARAAASEAACAAACAAHIAAYAAYVSAHAERAANASADAAAAAEAARAAAESAQIKMIAELGNPFKKGKGQ